MTNWLERCTQYLNISTENFCYPVPSHSDPRGVFVEMLKTKGSGQISFLLPSWHDTGRALSSFQN